MKSVLVPLASGSEELEAVTVLNILRRAGIEAVSASLDGHPIRGSRGTKLIPDTSLDEALKRRFDMVVLPGGQPGTNNLKADARIIRLVQRMAADDLFVCAVCAAPSVLAAAGLLDGKHATSFPGSLDAFPKVLRQPQAVVEDGKLITSRGPGTAMDFALTLVERLAGKAKRDEVEAGLVRT
ncbi:protein/nucleic acid deglycase 3 [Sideroxyarcus emersonii]|uniref:Protein/nucleic acid deglycase 3 n=1 Tax=Sideroxyarcus emersonii TaxID=2764705 RepID=A0AAN1X9D3_9PROT|nr:DJ-1 family glyoxalase III [Sideroxyarcus emersonii]BCK87178.1 protein/nucleic acid deglycase 3 [Sideroxyarcus emersonii]